MSIKSYFLLFSFLLLVHVCLSVPLMDKEVSREDNPSQDLRKPIIDFLTIETGKVKNIFLDLSVERFGKFLSKAEPIAKKTPEFEQLVSDVAQFVAEVEKSRTEDLKQAISEARLLHRSLSYKVFDEFDFDDNQGEEVESALIANLGNFNRVLNNFFEKLLTDLPPQQREANKELLTWYEEFKTEQVIFKRFASIERNFPIKILF